MVDMQVVEPARYMPRPKRRQKRHYYLALAIFFIVLVGAINYLRPLPATTASLSVAAPAPVSTNIVWPATGQAAIAAVPYGLLATSGEPSPLATASTAKILTALCVLQKEPLALGQTGPSYTVDADDVSIFHNYVAEDGSLVPVQQGENLTEYQALEALMIPSANNIADSLVRWVFGSQTAYASFAAHYLQAHRIIDTHIGTDASGFDPSTTSTASDLTRLGLLALKNPTLMHIAGQSTAELPAVGVVHNYDTVLGQGGITGLKTGNNVSDKGAFIFTATAHIGKSTIPLTGAVMGATSLSEALQDSVQLAKSMQHAFTQVTITRAAQDVGRVRTPWGATAPLITESQLQLIRWNGAPIRLQHTFNTKLMSGTVGTLGAVAGPSNAGTSLRLAHPLAPPTFWWRLMRL